uniref:Proline-rich proteoglycan 2-like n=1 Tax=Tursiops truncatus TaxID=9739 RepID=A0A6J3QAQ5_TURTR|nr:proline-rich proteoglycan 2-like [Tursiops truncatus]
MRPRARILSASFPPPAAWPPSLCRGPRKRRPQGSRPPGPPDIPGITAHNCTFPSQETSPAVERGPARRPHLRPNFAARRSLSGGVRCAPAPPPGEDVRTPGSPPPAAARALLAAEIRSPERNLLVCLGSLESRFMLLKPYPGPHVDVVTVGKR